MSSSSVTVARAWPGRREPRGSSCAGGDIATLTAAKGDQAEAPVHAWSMRRAADR